MTDAIDEQTAKKLKKLEKNSDTRMLDPWERYRALVDTYEAFFDMNELADRKTRFALVMMGALNALNVIFGTQRMFGDLTAGIRPLVGVYFMLYAALSLYFFIHAIATLRPRISMFPGGCDSLVTSSRRPTMPITSDGPAFRSANCAARPHSTSRSWPGSRTRSSRLSSVSTTA